MISHVPGPLERLVCRMQGRWAAYIDGLCAELPAHVPVSQKPSYRPPQEPSRGLPAVLARLQDSALEGSVRAVAKRVGVSKSSVHRAKQKRTLLQLENIP